VYARAREVRDVTEQLAFEIDVAMANAVPRPRLEEIEADGITYLTADFCEDDLRRVMGWYYGYPRCCVEAHLVEADRRWDEQAKRLLPWKNGDRPSDDPEFERVLAELQAEMCSLPKHPISGHLLCPACAAGPMVLLPRPTREALRVGALVRGRGSPSLLSAIGLRLRRAAGVTRPPLSTLLADPGSVVLRTDLLAAGWPERLVDAIFRTSGCRLPGYSRPFVLAEDVRAAVDARPVDGRKPEQDDGRPARVTVASTTPTSTTTSTLPHGVPGSAFIIARGEGPQRRFLVRFRLGGRESKVEHAGSFRRKGDAVERKNFVITMIAAGKGEEVLKRLRASPAPNGTVTLKVAAERWKASRVDVAAGTAQTYKVALARIIPKIGDKAIEEVDVAVVTDLVSELSSLKRESIRKTLNVLAMVLDHARVQPNPVRDPLVKLPRGERKEVNPPTAEHVEAVHRLLPTAYKLPLLVLDATGMRIGELEQLTWGDIDEPKERWRVSASVSKSGTARWVPVPTVLFKAVTALVARDDRVPDRQVFMGFGGDRFRKAITRACTASGIPTFSPHDLRHRRVSLLHLGGMPWARIGELVGHGDVVTTARTYTHVVASEDELDYAALLV
jgi:integrase